MIVEKKKKIKQKKKEKSKKPCTFFTVKAHENSICKKVEKSNEPYDSNLFKVRQIAG